MVLAPVPPTLQSSVRLPACVSAGHSVDHKKPAPAGLGTWAHLAVVLPPTPDWGRGGADNPSKLCPQTHMKGASSALSLDARPS